MTTPEGKVKAAIKKRLKQLGFWAAGDDEPGPEIPIKGWYYMPQNMGMGVSGVPDFIGSFRANAPLGVEWRPFGIEAKAPGGKPTQVQLDRHAEMRATGWLVLIVDDVNQLDELEALLG